jgi:hypothetical protein
MGALAQDRLWRRSNSNGLTNGATHDRTSNQIIRERDVGSGIALPNAIATGDFMLLKIKEDPLYKPTDTIHENDRDLTFIGRSELS